MRRNHQDRLAHVNSFADGFESGSTGIGTTSAHLFQEGVVVQRIETQRVVDVADFRFVFAVPKETKRNVGIRFMPGHDLGRESGIHHVTMDVMAFGYRLLQNFFAQERGTT